MIKNWKNVYFLMLVILWKVHFKAIKPASDRVSRWKSGENIWQRINIISRLIVDTMESSKPWFSGHILAQIWFCPRVLKIGSKNFKLSHRNGFHSLPSPTVGPSNAMIQKTTHTNTLKHLLGQSVNCQTTPAFWKNTKQMFTITFVSFSKSKAEV